MQACVTCDEVADTRRWLWEQFNVRAGRRPPAPPLAVQLWGGDPLTAAHSLQFCLVALVNAGKCDVADAAAWSAVASLTGRRTPKHAVAHRRGISERGLHNRIHLLDAQLADLITAHGAPPPPPAALAAEAAVRGLTEVANARMDGRHDEADGIYAAAADLVGVPPTDRAPAIGRDRTKRSRTRKQARAGLPLRAGHPPQLTPFCAMSDTDQLLVSPYVLSDEPQQAIVELEKAWQDRASSVIPVLLDHAAVIVSDEHRAGLALRLRLLEIGSNVLRDAESLFALAWSTEWLRTAARCLNPTDIEVIKARRTRAHVLQLHGHLESASRELDVARHAIDSAHSDAEHRRAESVDLLLRRTSVDIAQGAQAVDASQSRLTQAFQTGPNRGLLPGLLRNQVQLASLNESAHRRRRTFNGRKSRGYEAALSDLMELLNRSEPASHIAMWDSLLVSATRVGDTQTVLDAARAAPLLLPDGSPNLLHRLQLHLALAAKLPGLSEIADVHLDIPPHPLRRPDLIPHNPAHLV